MMEERERKAEQYIFECRMSSASIDPKGERLRRFGFLEGFDAGRSGMISLENVVDFLQWVDDETWSKDVFLNLLREYTTKKKLNDEKL